MPLCIDIIPVTPFQQNCSLIWDDASKRAAVVDPGGDLPRILGAIEETGVAVEKIVLTHGHIDHAGGRRS
jgi:glyoxylase-like metal-dependent hydrolase (beta-lactamase superfamily II)